MDISKRWILVDVGMSMNGDDAKLSRVTKKQQR